LPEGISGGHGRRFLLEFKSNLDVERPCIVFDCSRILQKDTPAIRLLLNCLEEAMKRNGDVKLSAMHEEAKAVLELTGVDHLFEIFATNGDAAHSFRRLTIHAAPQVTAPSGKSNRTAKDAAWPHL
jgi:anti-anti-sigma regulatory factor